MVDITLDFLSVDPPAMRFKLHGNFEPDNVDHPGVQGILFRLSCRECAKEADFEIRFEPGRGTCFYWHTDMQVFITESHARSLDTRRQLEAERNDPDAVPSNVARKLAALAKKYNLEPIQTQAISQAVLDIKRKMLANPRNIIPREDLKSFGHDVTQLANELGILGEDLDELGDAIVKGLLRI